MEAIGRMVPSGARLADIGTDHAYLPVTLVSGGKISCAFAMDIREGPLKAAEKHIRQAGLSQQICIRQSDGLAALKPGEADTLVLSGMGGKLILRILSDGPEVLAAVRRLVLSPQSDIPAVREALPSFGFRIADEDLVAEDGKFYTIIAAEHPDEKTGKSAPAADGHREMTTPSAKKTENTGNVSDEQRRSSFDEQKKTGVPRENTRKNDPEDFMEDYCGPVLLQKRHPLLESWLLREERIHLQILKNLENAESAAAAGRKQQVKKELETVQKALEIYKNGK